MLSLLGRPRCSLPRDGTGVRRSEQRVLRARGRQQRHGACELVVLRETSTLGTGIAEDEARDASIELAVEHACGSRLVLGIDHDAARRQATPELGPPFRRDGVVGRRLRLQFEGVLVERRDERLPLGRDGAIELLLRRAERIVGDDDVRCYSASAID